MSKRENLHTHCMRCGHARGTAADYVQEAVKHGLICLGFSDHLPFPDDRFGMRMPYAEIEPYLLEINRLKGRYPLEILAGFEGEFITGEERFYESLLTRSDCDYLIMGQHFFRTSQGDLLSAYAAQSTRQYVEYAQDIARGIARGYFLYSAHPDLIWLTGFPWDDDCDRACDIIIEASVRYHVPLEYNANGMRRGLQSFPDGVRYQYPHDRFWQRVAQGGAPVCIGSDCHSPELLWDDFMFQAYENLKMLGIEPVDMNELFKTKKGGFLR